MKKMFCLVAMLAMVVCMVSVSLGQSIVTTNYAFNTTAPSNYGNLCIPSLRAPGDVIGDSTFEPYNQRFRLTNGVYDFTWSQCEGWDGTVTDPPFFYVIDLGSVKTDINSVVAFNLIDTGSAITHCTAMRVYGSNDSTTTSFTFWGDMVCANPTDTTSWGPHMWSFVPTSGYLSARYVFVNPWFYNLGHHKLFSEIAVLSVKSPVDEWYLY